MDEVSESNSAGTKILRTQDESAEQRFHQKLQKQALAANPELQTQGKKEDIEKQNDTQCGTTEIQKDNKDYNFVGGARRWVSASKFLGKCGGKANSSGSAETKSPVVWVDAGEHFLLAQPSKKHLEMW